MDGIFDGMSHATFWLGLGLLLAAAEIALPGFFLIWLGLAAAVTGLVAWVFPIGIAAEVGLFGVLSIGTVYAARRWLVANPIVSDDPLLNDKGGRLVGELVTVVDAIEGGRGRVKLGDSVWNAKGPDAAVSARMRVTGLDGTAVIVEPA
jgi:membrane protein implicated in regulation of membrane protease activity